MSNTDGTSTAEACHYCERTERIKDVEDWQTGDVVPACYACRYDFDLCPVDPENERDDPEVRADGGRVTRDAETEHVEVRLQFDGHHGEGLEFIEAETADGESINLGEWDIGSGGSTLKLEVPERCVNTEADLDE